MTSTAIARKFGQGECTLGSLMHAKRIEPATEEQLKIRILMASLVCSTGRQSRVERQLHAALLSIGLKSSSRLILQGVISDSMPIKTLKINQQKRWKISGRQQLIIHSVLGNDLILTWNNSSSHKANELMLSLRRLAEMYRASLVEEGLAMIFGKRLHATRSYKGLSAILNGALAEEKKVSSAWLSDQTLLVTLKCFLDENMNLTDAARQLGLHRNTVLYRLTKLYQLTGLNPVNFVDAVILSELIVGKISG